MWLKNNSLARNFRQAKSIQQEIKLLEDQITDNEASKTQKESELEETKERENKLQDDFDASLERVRTKEHASGTPFFHFD